MMRDPQMKLPDQCFFAQCLLDASGSILTKHQVLTIAQRKGLLVFALDRRLNRGLQGVLYQVDHFLKWHTGLRIIQSDFDDR